MKNILPFACLVTLLATGCTTKTKARLQAHEAFIAGQRQAAAQPKANEVFIVGDVQNPLVPWTEGMTLSQALIEADYRGFRDPREIIITRRGNSLSIDPRNLLRGADEPLEPGDRIEIRR